MEVEVESSTTLAAEEEEEEEAREEEKEEEAVAEVVAVAVGADMVDGTLKVIIMSANFYPRSLV